MSLLAACLAWAAVAGTAPADGAVLDRVAAVVDDSPILLSEVEQRARPELRRLEAEGVESDEVAHRRADMLRTALQTLIDERLLDEQLKSANVDVTEDDLRAAIGDVMRLNGIADEAQLDHELRREGLTLDTYKKNLRRQLEKMKLINLRVRPQLKVSEVELRDEYQREYVQSGGEEEIRARHILIALKKGATEDERKAALAKAQSLSQRARSGEDFGELARKYSEGPSAHDGGELGWFKRGVMVPEFEVAAFALPKGAVSDPVLTQFGYHVIQIEDRRRAPPPSFDSVKEQLRQKLTQRETEQLTADYLRGLRKDASIQIDDPDLRPH